AVLGALVVNRRGGALRTSPWPYVAAGLVSWWAFVQAGLHPALGLIPIVPTIPHAGQDLGPFAQGEEDRPDLLNRMEHALGTPVQVILFLFGLLNAGVTVGAAGAAT